MRRLINRSLGAALVGGMVLLPGIARAAEQAGGAAEGGMTHRMMMLAMQLGAILFAARLGSMAFKKLKLPGVLGELTAGILIGPYLLGALALPALPHGLFPVQGDFPVSPELYGFCSVAAIVLLFMVGLETDIRLFLRYSVAGSLVGLGGVIVSFFIGNLLGVWFSPMLFGETRGMFAASSLFLGIMSTATSVGITARVLSERRKLDSPEGVTILAGAVIDDVLGIILLAIGLGVITASRASGRVDWAHIGMIAAKAVGIWLAATVCGLLASRRLGVLLKWFRDRSSIAMMALGFSLILAALFEEAGLAMIIGAYVMGLSLSRTDVAHVIREKLDPIYAFLVPVFFTVMGMLVDVRLLCAKPVLIFGAVYTVGAIIAKIVGCGVPALLCGFTSKGALRVGMGMMPRGEVALIIAGIGLGTGFLTPQVFGVGVMMTLVTTVLAPPLLVVLFRGSGHGIKREPIKEPEAPITFSFPSPQTAELLVGKLIQEFESDGFFVHALSHGKDLYQFRRDTIVIGLHHTENEIIFDCPASYAPLVNSAMLEVVADFEATIRELRKPFDTRAIAERIQATASPSRPGKTLEPYLTPELCIPDLKARTKTGVIDELLNRLTEAGLLLNVGQAREAILAREAAMSTGMQYGVAIPHGRTTGVERLVCVVGLHREGIDFESLDHRLAHIFILTLSPKNAPAPHVQFMATVSQILNADGREALLHARSAAEMYAVVTGGSNPPAFAERALPEAPRPRPAQAEQAFSLSRYLRAELLEPHLQAGTKEEAIDELLALIRRSGAIDDIEASRQAILSREAQMSTGMEHGVAIPHARIGGITALVCAIGVSRAGVDFQALDGQHSHIIVLTLSPEGGGTPHVQFMAALCRFLDEDGRSRVLAADTRDKLWSVLDAASDGK